jgi:hypothetical protein
MLRRFSLILIVVLFLASLAEGFHHHADGADHPDCPICVAGHYQTATPTTGSVFTVPRQFILPSYLPQVPTSVYKIFFTPANPRGPPA